MADVSAFNNYELYGRCSIGTQELIVGAQEAERLWPSCRLHKNEVTRNLTIYHEGEMVGQIDLLTGEVDDFWGDEEE